MTEVPKDNPSGWKAAWPDILAFAAGLTLAWFGHWETKDLVWSLWLSSLLVGYAMIVWGIFGKGVWIALQAWRERDKFRDEPKEKMLLGGGALLIGGLFMLAFFTVHFGGFHFVHSVFLQSFFPIGTGKSFPGLALYWQVLQAYWPFVLVAAVAERAAFRLAPASAEPPDTSVKAADVARRLAQPKDGFTGMMAPYRNVMRLHVLIFFFAFAHFAKLENFWIYATVYAVYFFPWRLVSREQVKF
ncbi:MAG: DUF6498-containing protein [bacterium]|nr:DUF6498-containing protein [bacterium]MDI1334594.1 DUF6498-containing protein [Lacunisphaera sp.]